MLYYGIELADGTIIQNLTCESGTTLPGIGSSTIGRMFFHKTQKMLYIFNGTSWNPLGATDDSGPVVVSFNGRSNNVTLIANDLVGLIGPANLPKATSSVLGAVKIGSGVNVDSNGVISVPSVTEIPSGSRLLWAQPTAPVGWTQVTTTEASNRFLRVVSTVSGSVGSGGTGGFGYGGIDDPIIMNKVPSHTHTVNPSVVTTSSAGAHTHGYTDYGMNNPGTGDHGNGGQGGYRNGVTLSAGAHTHTVDIPSTTTSANSGAGNWQPKYLNLILCRKD